LNERKGGLWIGKIGDEGADEGGEGGGVSRVEMGEEMLGMRLRS